MSAKWKPRGNEALRQREKPKQSPADQKRQRWASALTAVLVFLMISLGAYIALQLI